MPKPNITGLTPQGLITKTTELSKAYLEELLTIFSSSAKLNEAVKDRATLIINPSVRNVNDATLADVDDQFDAQGNKLSDATFTQHNPIRADLERKEFLRSENISERESIALVCAYFGASTTLILNNPNPNLTYFSKLIEAIRTTVANELRDCAGLSDPKGFELKKDMVDKIKSMLENPFDLVNKTISFLTIYPLLKEKSEQAKKFAEGHLEDNLKDSTDEAYITKVKLKQNLLDRTHTAINDFAINQDASKLLSTMLVIQKENNDRHGKKGKATKIINDVAGTAQDYITSLNNTSTIGHSSVVKVGMFGRSVSASPSPTPPSSNSPRMSDSSNGSDDEKKSPKRKS